MKKIKQLIAKYFSSFTYFFKYLRYKIFVLVILSIFVGILDGFGLVMFLPLLQMVNDVSFANADGLGNLGFLIDGINSLGIPLSLGFILAFMMVFFILKGIILYLSTLYRVILQQSFIRRLRLEMLYGLNKIQFKTFIVSDAGRIQNTMSGEVDKVVRGFSFYFQTIQHGVMVIIYMGFAFLVDAQFAILVSIGGALTNILYKTLYKYTKSASKKLTKDSNIYQGQIIQHIANFKYLRATGLETLFGKRIEKTILLIEKSRKAIGVYGAILLAAREPMLVGIVAVIILIQVEFLSGSLGGILVSLLFFYRALTALTNVQNFWNGFLEVSGSLDNMQDFQKLLKKNKEERRGNSFKGFHKQLQLKDAGFFYGKTQILSNISISIQKNETIAFVGESGSGKTTLVNILTGIMPLDAGQFLIDQQNALKINIKDYQSRIGYISQDSVIFNDTIFNNVSLWAKDTQENMQRFKTAIQQASLTTFIESLPQHENTILGNNGINLSGGQKQRVSIARELYKNIDILIMDEATSALDSETEKNIQENIDALKGRYTILVVAHRLSTVKNADRIVFMKQGQIDQIGTFNHLLKTRNDFKRMVELQEL